MPIQPTSTRRLLGPQVIDLGNFVGGVSYELPKRLADPRFVRDSQGVRMREAVIRPAHGQTLISQILDGKVQLVEQILQYSGVPQRVVLTTTKAYRRIWSDDSWGWEVLADGLSGSLDRPATSCFAQNTWIVTNGVDPVLKYNGTTMSNLLGGNGYQASETATHRARVVTHFTNCLFLLDTIEDGQSIPQRVRWSDIGELETWSSDSFEDLVDTPGGIVGAELLGNSLVIYKTDAIIQARPIGAQNRYAFTTQSVGVGLVARRSLIRMGNVHVFLGRSPVTGFNIYMNDGSAIVPIGDPIKPMLEAELTKEYEHRSWSLWNPQEEVVMFFLPTGGSEYPNRVWVYERSGGTRWWKDALSATGGGVVLRGGDYVSYGDLKGSYADQDWVYGQSDLGVEGQVIWLGGYGEALLEGETEPRVTGWILEVDRTSHVDMSNMPMHQVLVSKAFSYRDLNAPAQTHVRCLGIELVMRGKLEVYYSLDEGTSWTFVEQVRSDSWDRVHVDFDVGGESVMVKLQSADAGPRFWLEQWFIKLRSRGTR